MNGFEFDKDLFCSAEKNVNDLVAYYNDVLDNEIISLSANIPSDYEDVNVLNDVFGNLNDTKLFINEFQNQIVMTKKDLLGIETQFANDGLQANDKKWYEDIGDAFLETGSSWIKGFKSLFSGEGFEDLGDALLDTGSTVLVTGGILTNGLLKIGEYGLDSLIFLTGATLAGGALIVDQFTGRDDAARIMDATLDEVRRDTVGDFNDSLYKDTEYGKFINEHSNLKYDSAGANVLGNVSEVVSKVVLATGATFLSGGAAAPLVIGAFTGIGSGTEKYAQNVDRESGESYNHLKAIAKAGASAVAGAGEWFSYGQIGTGLVGASRALNATIASGSAINVKGALSGTISYIKNIKGIDVKVFANSFAKNFFVLDTALDSASVVVDHGVDWVFGDETTEELLEYGGLELLFAIGLNALGSGMGAAAEGINAYNVKFNYDEIDDILKNNINLSRVETDVPKGNDLFQEAGDLDDSLELRKVDTEVPKENELFNKAGDLDDSPEFGKVDTEVPKENELFQEAGDLDDSPELGKVDTEVPKENELFQEAGDLDDSPELRKADTEVPKENELFQEAGDLNDSSELGKVDTEVPKGNDLFQEAGDLNDSSELGKVDTEVPKENELFQEAGDLDDSPELRKADTEVPKENELFQEAGDLDDSPELRKADTEVPKENELFQEAADLDDSPELRKADTEVPKENELFQEAGDLDDSPELRKADTEVPKENELFQEAGDLDDSPELRKADTEVPKENELFQEAGDLDDSPELGKVDTEVPKENELFQEAADLDDSPELRKADTEVPKENELFQEAGDLDDSPELRKADTEVPKENELFQEAGDLDDSPELRKADTEVPKENELFQEAGDLDDSPELGKVDTEVPKENELFQEAGDLDDSPELRKADTEVPKENELFQEAGDLDDSPELRKADTEVPKENELFQEAGDLDDSPELGKVDTEVPKENELFNKAGDLDSDSYLPSLNVERFTTEGGIDVSNVHNSDELIEKLYDNSSSFVERDKKYISDYIEFKNNGNSHYMYTNNSDNVKSVNVKEILNKTFDDGGSGIVISGKDIELPVSELYKNGTGRAQYDYRITMRNSPNIKTDEAIDFINTFVDEANKRGLNLRAKNFWEQDALILYCDKDDLYKTVQLLEDLKNPNKYGELVANATEHFGPIQPFSATVGDNPYYGIAMAHPENEFYDSSIVTKSSYGAVGVGGTFNSYMDEAVLDTSYTELIEKYRGDTSKITADELYETVVKKHNAYMFGDETTAGKLPLWMNRRNYLESIKKINWWEYKS